MKKENKNIMEEKVIQQIINPTVSDTDPDGSYTAVPKEKYEKPVQDADDL